MRLELYVLITLLEDNLNITIVQIHFHLPKICFEVSKCLLNYRPTNPNKDFHYIFCGFSFKHIYHFSKCKLNFNSQKFISNWNVRISVLFVNIQQKINNRRKKNGKLWNWEKTNKNMIQNRIIQNIKLEKWKHPKLTKKRNSIPNK